MFSTSFPSFRMSTVRSRCWLRYSEPNLAVVVPSEELVRIHRDLDVEGSSHRYRPGGRASGEPVGRRAKLDRQVVLEVVAVEDHGETVVPRRVLNPDGHGIERLALQIQI